MPLSDQRKIELISQALTRGDMIFTPEFIARLFIREPSAVTNLRARLVAFRDIQSVALVNADAINTAGKATFAADVTDLDVLIPGV